LVKVPEEVQEAFTKNCIIPLATVDAANPQISAVGWNREGRGCYQIKGAAELKSDGPIYEKGHKMATGRERPLPGKAVAVIKVEEVYQASGGSTAGDRIV